MTFAEEFTNQWDSLEKFLESEMIKSNQAANSIALQDINHKLNNEKRRWKLPGQYNYAWLEKLRDANPDIAQAFEKSLASVTLEQVLPADKPNQILSAIPGIIGGGLGFGLTKLFKMTEAWIYIGTIGLAALGVAIGMNWYKQKAQDAIGKEREAYLSQINSAKDKLLAIVREADN